MLGNLPCALGLVSGAESEDAVVDGSGGCETPREGEEEEEA